MRNAKALPTTENITATTILTTLLNPRGFELFWEEEVAGPELVLVEVSVVGLVVTLVLSSRVSNLKPVSLKCLEKVVYELALGHRRSHIHRPQPSRNEVHVPHSSSQSMK